METGTYTLLINGQQVWKTIVDGVIVDAEFNSKGAAEAAIAVERNRRQKTGQ